MVWFKTFGCLGRTSWVQDFGGLSGHIWIFEIKDLADKCEGKHTKEQSKMPTNQNTTRPKMLVWGNLPNGFSERFFPHWQFSLNLRHNCFTRSRKKSKERKPMKFWGVLSYDYLDLFYISSYFTFPNFATVYAWESHSRHSMSTIHVPFCQQLWMKKQVPWKESISLCGHQRLLPCILEHQGPLIWYFGSSQCF